MSGEKKRSAIPTSRSLSERSKRSNSRKSSVKAKKAVLRKRSPRSKWKWAIRTVIANISWLADTTDVPLGDDAELNAYITSHRKEGQILSLEDKLFFKKPRDQRTKEALEKVTDKLQYFKTFREYPPKVMDELLMRLDYVSYDSGRVVVRQEREAEAMYFIVIGTVEVDHYYPDPLFPKEFIHTINKFGYGDSFGEDKHFFKKPRDQRTQEALEKVTDKLQYFKTFREYPPKVRDELLMRLDYVFYDSGRVVVRQEREAEAMYFIVIGTVEVDHYYPDPIFPKELIHNVDKLGYGDSFGEVPLFYGEPHGATITVLEPGVEMLVLYKSDFKIVLEETLSAHWGSIRWAISQFPYFSRWPEVAIRYLCSHSLLITIPGEIRVPVKDLNGLGIALFVLEGTVKVVQRLLIRVNPNEENIKKKFSLFSNQDCPGEKLPQNVIPIFMQTAKLRRNAVFGLGEILSKHMLMTETESLLMICPRFIIDRYNIINVWTRIVGILDSTYPKIEKVFEVFITNRLWANNRKKFAKSLNLPKADKNMTIHDTPVSSRAAGCLMKDKLRKKIQEMPQYKNIIKQMRTANEKKIRKSVKRSTIDEDNEDSQGDVLHTQSSRRDSPGEFGKTASFKRS